MRASRLFYLVTQNGAQYANQVKQSAVLQQKLSKPSEHHQTTSLQVVPDAGDDVIESVTHKS